MALKDLNENPPCICRSDSGLTKSVTGWRQKRSPVRPVDADFGWFLGWEQRGLELRGIIKRELGWFWVGPENIILGRDGQKS
jgi:hypothetical protein